MDIYEGCEFFDDENGAEDVPAGAEPGAEPRNQKVGPDSSEPVAVSAESNNTAVVRALTPEEQLGLMMQNVRYCGYCHFW